MENNQVDKIDKIFKDSLENQSVTPPSNAWMGIHTYTIGQEESKKKVGLRYVALAMALLIFLGMGLWYFVDNQIFVNSEVPKLLSQKVVSEDTDHGKETFSLNSDSSDFRIDGLNSYDKILKSTNPTNPNSDKNRRISSVEKISTRKNLPHELLAEHTENGENVVVSEDTDNSNSISVLLMPKVDWSGDEPRDIEPTSYFKEDEIKEMKPKPLILNNLSNEILQENERKITVLEEKQENKKEDYKTDSVVYGKGFSLRHPIITLGFFGTGWNFWDFGEYKIGRTYYPNERSSFVKLGLSWRVNKKLRLGVNIGANNYTLGVPSAYNPPWSSSLEVANVKLVQINSDQFYQAETPFGGVNIPVIQFINLPNMNPIKFDSVRLLGYYGVLPHSMQSISFSINSQFDLLSKERKRGKHYSYQIYGLGDINIQRQTKYFYNAIESYSSSNGYGAFLYKVSAEGYHLQNASEFVFGLRAGLGFRYQFARKWDFYIEGSGQHSLNNWVKSDDIKTFQRTISMQAGINLNL